MLLDPLYGYLLYHTMHLYGFFLQISNNSICTRMWTYVEKAKLRADVEDPAGGGRLSEQRQERLGQHSGPVEVGPEHRLGVLHRVGVDLVERYGGIVHLQPSSTNKRRRSMTSAPPERAAHLTQSNQKWVCSGENVSAAIGNSTSDHHY
jgi:hypothetical protein